MPKPTPKPTPGPVLYYVHQDELLTTDTQSLASLGITGVVTQGADFLHYAIHTRKLSLDEVRASIATVKTACGPLDLWLELQPANQAGTPPRTFYDPKDAVQRTLLLDNCASVAQACKELGVRWIGMNFETMGVANPAFLYPAAKARVIGADVAKALASGGASLFGLCPTANFSHCPGFQACVRGWYDVANKTPHGGVYFEEGTYGLNHVDVKHALKQCGQYTGAAVPCCGWWPDGNAPDPVATIRAAAQKVKEARENGRPIMAYHEGLLLTTDPGRRGALGQVLNQ